MKKHRLNQSNINQSNSQKLLNVDYAEIRKDLKKTIFLSIGIIALIIFLSFLLR